LLSLRKKPEERAEPISDDAYQDALLHGAGLRVRPVMMTVATIIIGLMPILYGTGTGSEIMSRIAAPMVGGMTSAVLLTLIVLPVIYSIVKKPELNAFNKELSKAELKSNA